MLETGFINPTRESVVETVFGRSPSRFRCQPSAMVPTEMIHAVLGLAFLAVWVMAGDIVLHDRR